MTKEQLTKRLQTEFGDDIQVVSMRTIGGANYYVYCYDRDIDSMIQLDRYLSSILPSSCYAKKDPEKIKKLAMDAMSMKDNQPVIFCSVTSRLLAKV